jgi:hypothetical protein
MFAPKAARPGALMAMGTLVGGRQGKEKGSNRRLEFQLCAGFVGPRRFVFVLSTARAMEHGLSPFVRANLHLRRNPLDRQR